MSDRRGRSENRRAGFNHWIMCALGGIVFIMGFTSEAAGCNASSVKLFVGETEPEAEESTDQQMVVDCHTAYWVRVEWYEGGSNDTFDVEVREILDDDSSVLIAAPSAPVADDPGSSRQSVTLKVDTTPYSDALDTGKHSIFARVRRHDMGWEPEENNSNNECTVYEVLFPYILDKESGNWALQGNMSVCKGDYLWFKAILEPEEAPFPDGEPVWGGEASGQPDGWNPVPVTFNNLGSPKTVTAECFGTTVTVTVYVKEAEFGKNGTQAYGFDSYGMSTDVPWKSVKTGAEDPALAWIVKTPVSSVYFRSTNTGNVELTEPTSPYNADESPETVKVKGLTAGGESYIEANWSSVSGTNLAKMRVKVYDELSKKLIIHIVHLPGESFDWPFNSSTLKSDLNEIYGQCVVSFSVVDMDLIDHEIDYDTVVNDDALTMDTTEEMAIKSACEDTNYDFNLYIVGNIKDTDGDSVGGYTVLGGSNAYIECSEYSTDIAAHEVGHMLGALSDITGKYQDDVNLMSYYSWGKGPGGGLATRLRKYQWDACNP